MRTHYSTTLNSELIKALKIAAVQESRPANVILEELISKYTNIPDGAKESNIPRKLQSGMVNPLFKNNR